MSGLYRLSKSVSLYRLVSIVDDRKRDGSGEITRLLKRRTN